MKRVLVIASLLLVCAAPALATDTAKGCFPIRQLDAWRAADAKTIYLRVAQTRYYRLDLGNACAVLNDRDAHLITKTTGSDLVCTAADWDLQASRDTMGSLPMHCIVKTMTPLTAAEADAIPKEFKPH